MFFYNEEAGWLDVGSAVELLQSQHGFAARRSSRRTRQRTRRLTSRTRRLKRRRTRRLTLWTRRLTRWTRGSTGWTTIRRRCPEELGSRLCLLETVTELGLRNLLFVYFLFGGRPGVGKV